jgi:hypothetical protein
MRSGGLERSSLHDTRVSLFPLVNEFHISAGYQDWSVVGRQPKVLRRQAVCRRLKFKAEGEYSSRHS